MIKNLSLNLIKNKPHSTIIHYLPHMFQLFIRVFPGVNTVSVFSSILLDRNCFHFFDFNSRTVLGRNPLWYIKVLE